MARNLNMDLKSVISGAQSSTYMVIAAANAIPTDKRDWKPGEAGTSATTIVSHCADFPEWIRKTIEQGSMAEGANIGAVEESFESAIARLQAETEAFCNWVPTLTEEDLNKQLVFPWETTTGAAVLRYHHWNNTYHLGQINYIQLLLGDREMHM